MLLASSFREHSRDYGRAGETPLAFASELWGTIFACCLGKETSLFVANDISGR